MVRSSVVLALAGVIGLGACDARPLRYGGTPSLVNGADAAADGAFDAGTVEPVVHTIAVGDHFSCALRGDGRAACWGFNGSGQATPPLDSLTALSAGTAFVCGLHADGTVVCWGANDHDQSTPALQTPSNPLGSGFIQVSAGDTHACALALNGDVQCWGSNHLSTGNSGQGNTIARNLTIASGTDFTCVLNQQNLLTCLGIAQNRNNWFPTVPPAQALGASHRTLCVLDLQRHAACFNVDDAPNASAPGDPFAQIGVGGDFACGLRDDGRILCWSTVPGQPLAAGNQPPDGAFRAISIGATHSCATEMNGAIVCWGSDAIAGRAPLVGQFSDVSVSGGGGIAPVEGTHGCAQRTDGTLACWGYEDNGEVAAPADAFRQVSVGLIHSCGIRASDDGVVCWGDRGSGEGAAPSGPFSQIASGFGFSCGVEIGGAAVCWGLGWDMAAPSGSFAWISAGYDDVCALRVDGTLGCWGKSGAPASVGAPTTGTYQQIGVGQGHSCATANSGATLLCWGGNTWGESSPPGGRGYRQVTVGDAAGGGGAHSCARAEDGIVVCWGDHSYGKCTPPSGAFIRIDAGENYTCGVSMSGQVWCWGLQARQPLD